MAKQSRRRGMSPILFILICLMIVGGTFAFTRYQFYKEKYKGSAVAYSREAIRALDENSSEYKIAKRFYSDEEWQRIRSNSIEIDATTSTKTKDTPRIEIDVLHGSTYQGYMMKVHNPEDVFVAVNPNLNSGDQAPSLEEYVQMHQAIGGINAGGFEDAGGTGNGGQAWGVVIHDGELVSGNRNEHVPLIGIDGNHRLVCVDGTADQALGWDIKEAVTFGPVFINNYEIVYKDGDGAHPMLNPRTAIGQQPDGTFLLLTLDGRGPSSFGALYDDVIEIFKEYDAYMAANLDGGNSTAMIYNGEYVNTPVSMYGSRHLPTVFLVKGE